MAQSVTSSLGKGEGPNLICRNTLTTGMVAHVCSPRDCEIEAEIAGPFRSLASQLSFDKVPGQ